MPGPYHNIILNLPGAGIGDIVAGLVRGIGTSPARVAATRRTAKNAFNDALYLGIRRQVFPAVKNRLTVRTGRLRRSFRMLRKGDAAIFVTVFYGQQRIVRPNRVTLRRAIIEEFSRRGKPIIEKALQASLDAVPH